MSEIPSKFAYTDEDAPGVTIIKAGNERLLADLGIKPLPSVEPSTKESPAPKVR